MSYSYSLLGTSCTSKTIAYTSNNKFLPLQSPTYLNQNTYMLHYPGREFSPNFVNAALQLNEQKQSDQPESVDNTKNKEI